MSLRPRPATTPGILLLLVLAVLTLGCSDQPAASLQVDRHRADLVVQPDGSMVVTEEFQGRLIDDARAFERRVESDRTDGITLISASLDGQDVTAGRPGPALLDVSEDDGALLVRWELTPAEGESAPNPADHSFALRYRVAAAAEVLRDRGRIAWPVLPAGRAWPVAASEVVLTLPEASEWLRGTGMAEAGWTVEATDRGVAASHPDVGLAPATLLAEFTIDRNVITLPDWQVTADLRGEFALSFVTGALFVVVIGAGVLWIVGFQYRTTKPRRPGPPAPGGGLAAPVSAAVVAALVNPQRADSDTLRELIRRGLVDSERLAVAQGLRTTAWVGGLFGIACAIVAQLTLDRFGWWAQVIPLSLVLMALVFLVAARRFEVRTPKGQAALGSGR